MRIKICLNYLISKFLALISHVYACSILIFMQNYESKISVLRSLLSIFKSRIQLFPDVLNHFLYLITSTFSKTCFIFILPYLQAEKYINQQNPTVFFWHFFLHLVLIYIEIACLLNLEFLSLQKGQIKVLICFGNLRTPYFMNRSEKFLSPQI